MSAAAISGAAACPDPAKNFSAEAGLIAPFSFCPALSSSELSVRVICGLSRASDERDHGRSPLGEETLRIPTAPRAFSAAHRRDCASERMGPRIPRGPPGITSTTFPARSSPARSSWFCDGMESPYPAKTSRASVCGALSTRTLMVRSSPSTSFCSAPSRRRLTLERSSTIRRPVNDTGWRKPCSPPGRSPALRNILATYSAARRCCGLPVSRPRIRSSARYSMCDHQLSACARPGCANPDRMMRESSAGRIKGLKRSSKRLVVGMNKGYPGWQETGGQFNQLQLNERRAGACKPEAHSRETSGAPRSGVMTRLLCLP